MSDSDRLGTTDAERRHDLAKMKRIAGGLLVFAAVVFLLARWQEGDHRWVGYIRAFAEAAMIGALADWFAVTALFRHPLGIPIPHTAIIKKRKDQIGDGLGEFVRDNFLTRDVISERLESANLGLRVGQWLASPENAAVVGDQSAAVVRGITEILQDEKVQQGLDQVVEQRVRSLAITPLVGRAIDLAMEGDHHHALVESTLTGIASFLDDNQRTFRQRMSEESPWWVPEPVDDVVFQKIYAGVSQFLGEVGKQRNHPLRIQLDERTRVLSERLKTDPELEARATKLKDELLAHPEFRAWSESLWQRTKSGLFEATENPNSPLRVKVQDSLVEGGRSIEADPELQKKLDVWIVDAIGYVAEQFRDEVVELIASTVQRWDGDETSDRLELQVGRDLQFIRINGTIVGGLAGLVIYSISELLF